MTTYTPGPWSVLAGSWSAKQYDYKIMADGEVLAVIHGKNPEADARLMGAAPDLIAACQCALELLASNGRKECVEKIQAALRKALAGEEGANG